MSSSIIFQIGLVEFSLEDETTTSHLDNGGATRMASKIDPSNRANSKYRIEDFIPLQKMALYRLQRMKKDDGYCASCCWTELNDEWLERASKLPRSRPHVTFSLPPPARFCQFAASLQHRNAPLYSPCFILVQLVRLLSSDIKVLNLILPVKLSYLFYSSSFYPF